MRLTLLALVLATPLAAQTKAPISAADLKTRLYALAHDSMGGRATGSLGNYKAAEYVAAEFRRLGLEPAGDNGSYFQIIPFFRFQPDPTLSLAVDGTPLQLGRDILPLAGARIAFDRAPIVASGNLDDSTTWAPSEAIAGNIVVLNGPTARQIGTALGTARAPRFAAARLVLVALLDDLGSETAAAITAGRVTTDTTRRGPTGGPAVALVSRAVAERLSGSPGHLATGQLGSGYFALPYAARNVAAILRGRDRNDRNSYLAVTGHNDHVGFDRSPVDHDSLRAFNRVIRPMGADSRFREPTAEEQDKIRTILDSLRAIRPSRLDSIRNGADDDGTGTVGLLEIAEQLSAKPRLKRSVLFVSHAAEEEGLLGSAWFTDHPTVPIDSIVSETDLDMIGRGRSDDLPDAGPAYLEMIGMRRLSTEYGDIIDRHPLQYYCRADHYNYARYGIPSVALSRGEHLDYHQVTDEAQYIDYDALERVTRLVAEIATEIGNLDHRPKLDQPKGDPRAQCRQ